MLPYFSAYKGGREITAAVTLALLSPFLWALAFRRTQRQSYANIWAKPFQRGPLIIVMLSRMLLALFYIGFLFDRLYSPTIAVVGVVVTCLALIIFYKRIRTFYGKIESRFLTNLNEREEQSAASTSKILVPWDTHLSVFELNAQSPYIGKTLRESKIREEFGVNLAIIERENVTINIPDREQRLYPYDRLTVIGTDVQLKNFKEFIESAKPESQLTPASQSVSLQHFVIDKNSVLLGKNIRHSGIRERTKGLVVGVERKGEHILNPESDFVFEKEDIVWIVGNEKRIMVLSKETKVE
jgi:CPA2 family monovalent cation:H+ antiporter-2